MKVEKRNKGKGLGFYYSACFFLWVFFLFLDWNYRSVSLISYNNPGTNVVNGAVMLFIGGLICLSAALIIIFASRALRKDFFRLFCLLGYLIFIYINSIFLKFYIFAFLPDLKTAGVLISTITALIPAILYSRWEKTWTTFLNQIFNSPFYKISLIIPSISLVVSFAALLPGMRTPAAGGSMPSAGRLEKPHVLLITFDSLSASHMSLYGYHRPTTPHIHEFASESYSFKRMFASSNFTRYSLPAFLGRYPRKASPVIDQSLVSVLGEHGYHSRYFIFFHWGLSRSFYHAFTNNIKLMKSKNPGGIEKLGKHSLGGLLFGPGNKKYTLWLISLLMEDQRYINLLSTGDPRDFDYDTGSYPLGNTFDYMVGTLKTAKSPVFIMAHLFEPHSPYYSPKQFRDVFGSTPLDRYDASIMYLDDQFGRFIEKMRDENLLDECIIIISSDHGQIFQQQFKEKYKFQHSGNWLEYPVAHIPCIIRVPGGQGGCRPETTANIPDIPPTILDLLGIPIPLWMEGESLTPYMKNPDLMSPMVKLCIPSSYYIRQVEDLRKTPPSWSSVDREQTWAFMGEYLLQTENIYRADPGDETRVNILQDIELGGLYNIVKDPEREKNLVEDPGKREIIRQILNSPVYMDFFGKGHQGVIVEKNEYD